MASSTETAKAYFAALSDHDVDAALAFWGADGLDHIAGQPDPLTREELRVFLGDLFAAFPDFRYEILDTTTYRERCAVRWRAQATFAGPGRINSFAANGERIDVEGVDVLSITAGLIRANHVYMDRVDMFAQLGLLAATGSRVQRPRALFANVRSRLAIREAKVIAPGVWLLASGFPATMNVYLLAEPDGGATVFDAGVRSMAPAIAAAAARLGGLRRFVLGHADCDHRGGAAALGAPVYTHAEDSEAAESTARRRSYWDLSKLAWHARAVYPLLFSVWDGGALDVAGTVAEGDEVAGFHVVHLPGHAPGLIGLFREEDGLALCSDALYTLNVETGVPGGPRVPHAAFNQDTEQARASLLKLAALSPRVVWAGHARPVSGHDVPDQLIRAAHA